MQSERQKFSNSLHCFFTQCNMGTLFRDRASLLLLQIAKWSEYSECDPHSKVALELLIKNFLIKLKKNMSIIFEKYHVSFF